ncbi:MAG TPA: glycosyltransferase family 1 protein [Puia sp.]|nr:glycosyltransferase family 1 protein [Puia sp.]
MRIGIDAKWLFTGPVSTRVVLQNLLPELFALHPEHQWVLFLDKKDRGRPLLFTDGNIEIHYVWADNNMLSNLFTVPRLLRRLKVDVMVFQTFPSLRHPVPSVAFIHDVLFRSFPQFFSWKERLYFIPLAWLTRTRADRLVATTEFVADELIRYRYTRSRTKIDIVPLAVSKTFRPGALQDAGLLSAVRQKFGLPDRYLLYVGRLNVRKNIENLLRALPLLEDKQIPLVIIGKEDWKAPDLRELLSLPAISQRILLAGTMTDEELTATYSQAKIFCFPSFAEGFGLPPLEAMAAGIPVVVSDTTSLPEVCGDAAVYIEPGSPESIARALNELLADTGLYDQKSKMGLARARQYTWQGTARALMNSIANAAKNV